MILDPWLKQTKRDQPRCPNCRSIVKSVGGWATINLGKIGPQSSQGLDSGECNLTDDHKQNEALQRIEVLEAEVRSIKVKSSDLEAENAKNKDDLKAEKKKNKTLIQKNADLAGKLESNFQEQFHLREALKNARAKNDEFTMLNKLMTAPSNSFKHEKGKFENVSNDLLISVFLQEKHTKERLERHYKEKLREADFDNNTLKQRMHEIKRSEQLIEGDKMEMYATTKRQHELLKERDATIVTLENELDTSKKQCKRYRIWYNEHKDQIGTSMSTKPAATSSAVPAQSASQGRRKGEGNKENSRNGNSRLVSVPKKVISSGMDDPMLASLASAFKSRPKSINTLSNARPPLGAVKMKGVFKK
ncbi:hypothetical protein, variant [Sphaeroforma arctica JP610]|uniref:Uncharacterized protein n=1 Tax=Sphaeroforma arctica JP610 TaxID=667725 RepID=A0A0L0FN08_9EUKA|nr:hypothetical protein, variant [Sphaeroforma arctica JP610]KNC78160.1 hypothetical protein, variant [Sphaeroforma arctica JP610]|eukprot:XP_014152062.1 hypothetical protein, variant [Sphaeroforma arctica JP610]